MANYSIEVQGLDEIMWRIKSLPDEAKKQVLTDVGEYSVETLRKLQAKQKYVTRKEAYGKSFFTDKQRRYFFWALREGIIDVPYKRTGTLAGGWAMRQTTASFMTVVNTVPYAPFVQGFMQSRHEKLVGWKRVVDILAGELSFRSSKFRKVVMDAVQKAIRKLKLG